MPGPPAPATSVPPSVALDTDPVVQRSSPPASRGAQAHPALTSDGRVKLLLADDERVSRRILEAQLTEWGYDVVSCGEGGRALTLLLQKDAPRLALVDWEMPGLSGVDIVRLLRGRSDAPYVYVVLCTGREGQRHLIDGLSAGADDYIRKPFDLQELEVRLRAGRRVVLLQDQLLEAHAELERRAMHDSLTTAKNRGAIVDTLTRELARARRTRRPTSVVLCDVDHFKRVNDEHGHPAGDAVLQELVRRVRLEVRTHDDVGRWGGEEFLVVLPECPAEEAVRVAERLRDSLARDPVPISLGEVQVTASFGVTGTDQGYFDLNSIVSAADTALYSAKSRGRNRVVLAEASIDAAGTTPIRASS
ncbi:MAG TPA: diguanylate cyclase [Polyangiaceae bacterium]|nr:diguanylate cyclase [Polyangiaceae bacterium]